MKPSPNGFIARPMFGQIMPTTTAIAIAIKTCT
jgi:hypothetical protein